MAKRDKYLNDMEVSIDKQLDGYNSLQLALVKNLLRNKYRGVVQAMKNKNNKATRVITIDEIKELFREEFEKMKDIEDVEVEDPEGGWSDVELDGQIDWLKDSGIKEALKVKLGKK